MVRTLDSQGHDDLSLSSFTFGVTALYYRALLPVKLAGQGEQLADREI